MGFGASALISYLSARASIDNQIEQTTLPLSTEIIDAELESQLFQKVAVARAMAANSFLLQWMEEGEREPASVIRYLRGIRHEVRAVTAFFVSEATGRYYHPDGVLKRVSAADRRDAWYYRFRGSASPFEINIDRDTAQPERVTAFINQKLRDAKGHLLGAIGIGVEVRSLSALLRQFESRYRSEVVFSDGGGRIQLASWGHAVCGQTRLTDLPGLAPRALRLLSRPSDSFRYR